MIGRLLNFLSRRLEWQAGGELHPPLALSRRSAQTAATRGPMLSRLRTGIVTRLTRSINFLTRSSRIQRRLRFYG